MTPQDAASVVREFEDAYAEAFDHRDAKGLAMLLIEDATLLTEWGDVVNGRTAFERGMTQAFARRPGHLRLENTPVHTQAITDDVIVSHGTSLRESGSEVVVLAYTRVLVRKGHEWKLAANHVAERSSQPDPRASDK